MSPFSGKQTPCLKKSTQRQCLNHIANDNWSSQERHLRPIDGNFSWRHGLVRVVVVSKDNQKVVSLHPARTTPWRHNSTSVPRIPWWITQKHRPPGHLKRKWSNIAKGAERLRRTNIRKSPMFQCDDTSRLLLDAKEEHHSPHNHLCIWRPVRHPQYTQMKSWPLAQNCSTRSERLCCQHERHMEDSEPRDFGAQLL